MMDDIKKCSECNGCLSICPTYIETNNEEFSPIGRLKNSKLILSGGKITEQIIESIYNCPECGICEIFCPENIPISKIVAKARDQLVKDGYTPLDKQQKIIKGIENTGNSVRGDPEKRLDWLPEPFQENNSENLLFLGCLPSYLVKDVAKSSYLALKKANFDFKILKNEGCCGIYFFDAGKKDLAEIIFRQNVKRFKKLGIKTIIVPCVGCYRCFKTYYPELLGTTGLKVKHISEILAEQIKKGNLKLTQKNDDVVYHDPCRLGRKEGIYNEPRAIIRARGLRLVEVEQNREKSHCCGAGAGIRSLYRELSEDIAHTYLKQIKYDNLITSCSFCVLNFRAAIKKNEMNKKIKFIADVVID
ncbi:MAG: (Fe-S)-binding protein [Candidatus Lokiarchaeota archaeon]|nr:(Fe-S)-binding protein [Candidatus Lokiarchaeota archaeon]